MILFVKAYKQMLSMKRSNFFLGVFCYSVSDILCTHSSLLHLNVLPLFV